MAEPSTSTGLNLTQTTHFARLAVKYGSIALAVIIVGRIFVTSFIAFWKTINPPPPPPPTVGFGILPGIPFPEQSATPLTYTLETASGTLPTFGDRAKVFLMIRSTPSLIADQRARQIAATYNFVFEPTSLDSSTYEWQKSQPINMRLEMDIFSHRFELSSDYLSRPNLLTATNLPDDFTAVQQVKNFLSAADLLPSDVATAAGEITYLKSLGGELAEAVSFSDADFLEVNLNRNPIDGLYHVYGPQGYRGSIHAIISGVLTGKDSIVEMDYAYQEVDYNQVETYPIRTSQDAWKILKAGEGYVAEFGGSGDTAVIRNVSLGYYETREGQDYLEPIYVFEGDDGFLAYVPALDPTYLQSE